jgi:hypothetical protein
MRWLQQEQNMAAGSNVSRTIPQAEHASLLPGLQLAKGSLVLLGAASLSLCRCILISSTSNASRRDVPVFSCTFKIVDGTQE